MASVGEESHPLFLKVEQLCLVGESSKMCLIRGSEKAVLGAPERWACVCSAGARACAESGLRPIDAELHLLSGKDEDPRRRAWPLFCSTEFFVACKRQLKCTL